MGAAQPTRRVASPGALSSQGQALPGAPGFQQQVRPDSAHSFGRAPAGGAQHPGRAAPGSTQAYGSAQSFGSVARSQEQAGGVFVRKRQATGKFSKLELAAMVFVPVFFFILTCYLFAYLYDRHPLVVWLWVLLGIFYFTSRCRQASLQAYYPSLFYVPLKCTLSLIAGGILGLAVYDVELKHFWFYERAWAYVNVVPSNAAGGYADAGLLAFADETRLDTSRSLGFKDGPVYCVAPIVGDEFITSVQFWAVGVDCCGRRGNFVCDDAWNAKARSGMVVSSDTRFLGHNRDQYLSAIRQAEVAFAISSAKDPVLVRWVVDPEKVQNNMWLLGVGIFVVAALAHLVFSCVFISFLQTNSVQNII